MTTKSTEGNRIIVTNRQARRDYEILETFEAGLVLVGSEVKSLRDGRANVKDAYAELVGDELFLLHLHISPYAQAGPMGHQPERRRKLLMRRRELERLRGKIIERGLTLIPLSIYFKGRWVKVELGLGRGKKQYDKRQDVAERESKREMARAMRRDQRSGGGEREKRGRERAIRAAACAAMALFLAMLPLFAGRVAAGTNPVLVRWGPRMEPDHVDAKMDGGTLYLPVNIVARWLGAVKEWDPSTLTLTLRTPRHVIRVIAGNRWVTLNGKLVNLADPARLDEGAIEVPLSFMEELAPRLLERRVHWEPDRAILTFYPPDVNILRVDFAGGEAGVLRVHVELAESLRFELDSTRPGEVRLRVEGGEFEKGMESEAFPVLPVRRVTADHDGDVAEIIFEMADDAGTATATPAEGGHGIDIGLGGFIPEESVPPPLDSEPFTPRPFPRDAHTRKTPIIVVDPGHGGSERGAVGPTGFLEKKATLEIALHLKRILEHDGAFRVMLTREEDRLEPLARRAAMANLFEADLFLSIHCNSWPGGMADGFEVYVTRPGSSSPLDSVRAAGLGSDKVSWDAAQEAYVPASRELASVVREELKRLGLRDRGTRAAKFAVLRGVASPAVLVETAFISNPEEESRLQDASFQAEIANALAEAVRRFTAGPTPFRHGRRG